VALAQNKKATKEKKEKIPPPEDIDLVTEDGVALRATFFPGTKGKDTVPVILLHMWKGERGEYKTLAPYLQSLGHAVLVPDLRGHGESTRVEGFNKPLDAAVMPTRMFHRMVEDDMETLKRFLMEKHNAGELNIEKLCVVGAELGASVALDWARLDWSWPPLATGKQGQDVRALVLISPQWSCHGLNLKKAMAHPRVTTDLSVFIVVGKETPKAVRDADRLYKMFKRHHPDPPPDKSTQLKDLFFGKLNTSLQGTKMLGVKSLRLEGFIAKFIDMRLVKQNIPWKAREEAFK
jgi:alpha-beta hydrolase superfamily lysophospholipase